MKSLLARSPPRTPIAGRPKAWQITHQAVQKLVPTAHPPSMSQQNDYITWQHAQLIDRVHQLELELRAATKQLSNYTEKEAAKKPARPFDASKHAMRKIALKFAYLGANYNGLEHHSGTATSLPAVEKVLWQALVKTRLIAPQFREGQSEDDVCWDGCEYSKCGRTDKGVSSFGQVIGVKVRSARQLPRQRVEVNAGVDAEDDSVKADSETAKVEPAPFDPVKDELPYIFMLNKVLPPDIRILAWCPDPPPDFDARFSCRERRYRYFFTNPAFLPIPGQEAKSERWLDIDAMKEAATKYEGLHDFRNFCKIDGAKQITNFERRIFHSGIHVVAATGGAVNGSMTADIASPKLYYFEIRGSAFLWHQVRHLVAILFLVGQKLEQPSVVDDLLDVQKTPARPTYQMASDAPLVLWECIFPDLRRAETSDHVASDGSESGNGYHDNLRWLYANDESAPRIASIPSYNSDRRYDREGVLENLWSQWRGFKLKEVLAQQLMLRVVETTGGTSPDALKPSSSTKGGTRVFEGADDLRSVGPYMPLMRRSRAEPADVVNARYAAKKSIRLRAANSESVT